jgi:Flp pilus assembly protein TadD
MLMAGCARSYRASASGDYQTVAQDPNRDTERARRQNQEALACMDRGDWEHAEKLLKEALSADLMFGPAHNNLGQVYYRQKKLYLAAWEFEYASKLMPHQPEPRNNLGLVFEACGKLPEAIGSYEQAMKLEPDNPQFIGNLARARLRKGDRSAEVRELLSKLIERDTRPQWIAWARTQLALVPKTQPADH